MKKLCVLVVLGLLLLGASCDTKNIGPDVNPNRLQITVTAPTDTMNGGVDASWTATVQGVFPPYNVTWNFGGGANPNTVTESVAAASIVTVNMVNPSTEVSASYSGTASVTDASGNTADTAFDFTVERTLNQLPVVDSAVFSGAVLTVMASDVDGDAMTITVVPPAGASVDAATKDYVDGGITFNFMAESLVDGVSGNVSVTANDGIDDSEAVTAALTIDPFVAAADTIYALDVGGNRIAIITGVLPNPFQYLNGVGLTVGGDLEYELDTFNAGALGGAANEIDGAWAMMNPEKFLMPPEDFILRTELPGDSGRGRIDFNLTPIEGSDVTGLEGMLINFELSGTAGTYTLGFHDEDTVERTYYSDGDAAETTYFLWGNYMADEFGVLASGIDVDNSYTVN